MRGRRDEGWGRRVGGKEGVGRGRREGPTRKEIGNVKQHTS